MQKCNIQTREIQKKNTSIRHHTCFMLTKYSFMSKYTVIYVWVQQSPRQVWIKLSCFYSHGNLISHVKVIFKVKAWMNSTISPLSVWKANLSFKDVLKLYIRHVFSQKVSYVIKMEVDITFLLMKFCACDFLFFSRTTYAMCFPKQKITSFKRKCS